MLGEEACPTLKAITSVFGLWTMVDVGNTDEIQRYYAATKLDNSEKKNTPPIVFR